MEKPVVGVSIICDHCQKVLTTDENHSVFADGEDALEEAALSGWWCDGYGHHYCPKHRRAAEQREAKDDGVIPQLEPDVFAGIINDTKESILQNIILMFRKVGSARLQFKPPITLGSDFAGGPTAFGELYWHNRTVSVVCAGALKVNGSPDKCHPHDVIPVADLSVEDQIELLRQLQLQSFT